MKFGHEIAAEASELPAAFRPLLLPYKCMKKMVKAVVIDLENHGLPKVILTQLLEKPFNSDPCLKYVLGPPPHGPENHQNQNQNLYLDHRIAIAEEAADALVTEKFDPCVVISLNNDLARTIGASVSAADSLSDCEQQKSAPATLTVHLRSDAEFFEYLDAALRRVSDFQTSHLESRLRTQLNDMGEQLRSAAGPMSRDRNIWRGLMNLYLESGVATQLGQLSADKCVELLVRFEAAVLKALRQPRFDFGMLSLNCADLPTDLSSKHVESTSKLDEQQQQQKRGNWQKKQWFARLRSLCRMVQKDGAQVASPSTLATNTPKRHNELTGFRTTHGWQLLARFLNLNAEIIALRRLMQLTHTAVAKIVKKHDKKTGLPSRLQWVVLAPRLHATGFLRGCMQQVAEALQRVAPPLADHTCPVCLEIAYPPLRLPVCGHLFCRSCVQMLALQASVPTTSAAAAAAGVPFEALRLPILVLFHRFPGLPDVSLRCPLCRTQEGRVSRGTLRQCIERNSDARGGAFLKEYFGDLVKIKKREWRARTTADERELLSYTLLPLSR